MPDIIFINQLAIEAIIGIYPNEREIPQTVLIDLEMHSDTQPAALSSVVNDTIDYAQVVTEIKSMVIDERFLLLESLVESVASRILENPLCSAVKIRAAKPQAIDCALGVGVEIFRKRV